MIFILRRKRLTIVSNKRAKPRKRRKWRIDRCVIAISGAAVFILLICGIVSAISASKQEEKKKKEKVLPQITIQTKLLTKNEYSRPGLPLKKVGGIVVHYTANPGTDAMSNRNYFNNLPQLNKKKKNKTYASSHFVIGLEGQIVQCIPLEEIAYASNERNEDTISIECCHPDKSGEFTSATYKALLELTSYLCIRYDLDEDDVIRHYDVTGKMCPLYFVEHENEWNIFKEQINKLLR